MYVRFGETKMTLAKKKVENSSCNQTAVYGKGESLALRRAREALHRHQVGVWKERRKIQILMAKEAK